MKTLKSIILISSCLLHYALAQNTFNYELVLEPISIPNLPGIHSYAFGQDGGKWLLIGGRKDGLHARQPFNAFPELSNNTDIYVVDWINQQVWSSSINVLSTNLKEQLQATNMNYYQEEDTLYILGGYAFANSVADHITFPYLSSIDVPGLINAVVNNQTITPFFKQVMDEQFAVTGGQLGKIGNTFYLVGGQRFDGRYNPMNMPTFVQTYTDKIQKFNIDNSGTQLSFSNYSAITDQIHLHRRDYNLMPQIFPDGSEGYTLSSGVFQLNADLPFLYPVDITDGGYTPQMNFNQYLSNYHSAHTSLYDAISNTSYMLFFGGMAQYYYDNDSLIQDDGVPFVKTISLVSRKSDGSLEEFALPVEMPSLEGASSEFIPNYLMPRYDNEVIKLNEIANDTFLIGHIVGGIASNQLNPFNNNQTGTTAATNQVYAVKLIANETPTGIQSIQESNHFDFSVSPNPAIKTINISFTLDKLVGVDYFISDMQGKIISTQELFVQKGLNELSIEVDKNWAAEYVIVHLSFGDKYYQSKKVFLK